MALNDYKLDVPNLNLRSYDLSPSIISDANVLGVQPNPIVNPTATKQGPNLVGSAARIGTAAATGLSVGGPVGGAIAAGVSSLIELGFQIFDYSERKKEADRIARLENETRLKAAENEAEQKRLYKEDLSRRNQMDREARRERQKEWAWREEDRTWTRNREAVNYFMNTISQKPALEDMLLSRWRKAA